MSEDDFRKDVWSELFLPRLQDQKMNQACDQDFLDSLIIINVALTNRRSTKRIG